MPQAAPFFDPTEHHSIRLTTLAQLAHLGRWQIDLAHDRPDHLLLWITRGQGVALLDGARRGFGPHNALFVPARHLMALDPGRQALGLALLIPPGLVPTLPGSVRHLRTLAAPAQGELTALLDALGREQAAGRPLADEALRAHAWLVSVWLRRQLALAEPEPPATAARRLVRAYCAHLVTHFATGASMAGHAAALEVSPAQLTRACQAETGHSAADLLTRRRLHAARLLLAATRAPVQDIAAHLGFSSPAQFARFVRQHTGQPPGALRAARRPGP